jgi:putative glycosyltransferase
MKLSIVTTLYKSKQFLEIFIAETLDAIDILNVENFELIFVNDGSPDTSVSYLIEKKKQHPEIIVIDLSRNFGHHYAMQAGLSCSKGELVFLIDNDLETSPYFLLECYQKISENNDLDVVYGYQQLRKGSFVENMGGKLFWYTLNKFSDIEVPKNVLTERLMSRRYVDNLLELGDANLFIAGMMSWVGYNQVGIPAVKNERNGKSTYTTKKRIQLMVQAITSFSGKPLQYLFYLGVLITFFSLLSILYLLIQKIIFGDTIQLGWTSLVAISFLSLGILSTFLGLIGIYLFKIFRQVQSRPNFIIKKIYK